MSWCRSTRARASNTSPPFRAVSPDGKVPAPAGDDHAAGHGVSQRNRGRQRLYGAKDLTRPIAVLGLAAFTVDVIARVVAAKQARRMQEQARSFGRVALQAEHIHMLPALPLAQGRYRHGPCL